MNWKQLSVRREHLMIGLGHVWGIFEWYRLKQTKQEGYFQPLVLSVSLFCQYVYDNTSQWEILTFRQSLNSAGYYCLPAKVSVCFDLISLCWTEPTDWVFIFIKHKSIYSKHFTRKVHKNFTQKLWAVPSYRTDILQMSDKDY